MLYCTTSLSSMPLSIVCLYTVETWTMKVDDMQRLERTERMMVRWMCGVTLNNKILSQQLLDRLGVVCVAERVRRVVD